MIIMNETCLIFDGLNIFTRHYIANPSIGENGDAIGGVVGMINAIASLCEKFSPTKVFVIWEGGGSSRKRSIFPEYKSGRRPQRLNRYYDSDIPNTVENRNEQVQMIISVLRYMPVSQIYVEDCEADDVIGYICKYKLKDSRKVIVSSDKDFYQLLDKKTIIYSPTWKKFVSFKQVKEKFGISSKNFCLAKCLCGDPSDNIPGAKGAGFKTISKRFTFLDSDDEYLIDDILQACNDKILSGSKVKVFRSILDSESQIRKNWKLIMLDTNNLSASQIKKIENSIDTFKPVRNKMKAIKTLRDLSITSINIDRAFISMRNL